MEIKGTKGSHYKRIVCMKCYFWIKTTELPDLRTACSLYVNLSYTWGKCTLKLFFQSISWNMKYFHELLSWITFTLVSKSHFLFSSSIEKLSLQRKDIFWQRKLILINNICCWMKPWLKNRKDKCLCQHILRTSVNCQIPAISLNECYIILLIIHWFLYIDYLCMS